MQIQEDEIEKILGRMTDFRITANEIAKQEPKEKSREEMTEEEKDAEYKRYWGPNIGEMSMQEAERLAEDEYQQEQERLSLGMSPEEYAKWVKETSKPKPVDPDAEPEFNISKGIYPPGINPENFDFSQPIIDTTKEYLTEKDVMAFEDDPYGDDKFPYRWDTPQRMKSLYDSYLGRIPFSPKLPKNVYKGIFGLEIQKKIIEKTNSTKLSLKAYARNKEEILAWMLKKYEFTPGEVIDIDEIVEYHRRRGFVTNDLSQFVDLKDGKVIVDSNYDIFIIDSLYSLDDLPSDISQRDLKTAKDLNALIHKYKDLKEQGYISDEGSFIIDDMRPCREDEVPWRVRNQVWTAELDAEVWAGRMAVIKKKAISIEEYEKQNPTDIRDEYPKPNTIEYKEVPHPYDERYVMIDGKIAHAGVNPKAPFYPQWKKDTEYTVDEIWKLEAEYANDIFALEEEIKELKRQFKDKRSWYETQGVQVKVVDRAVRKIKRESKRTPQEERVEEEIYQRLIKNNDLMARLNALSVG